MKRGMRKHTLTIVAVLGIANIPLLFTLPAWISLWCITLWGYAVFAQIKSWPWPNRSIRLGLTIAGSLLAFSFLGQGRLDGRTFVGLLAIMAGLKPLENERHRDRMMTLFLVYFTIISSLFVIENFMITLYMFFSVFITTASLIHFNHPDKPPVFGLRLSAIIMAQAVPIMIVLFIFFPRLEGTYFTFRGGTQGRTGFSETLKPGAISRLVKDNKTAFRAAFLGDIPAAEDLYWRGLVLWRFNGSGWERGIKAFRLKKQYHGQRALEYDITIEPHQKNYLFALDLPVTSPAFTYLMDDHTLIRRWPLRRGFRYRVKSYTDVNPNFLALRNVRALQLPDEGNPQSRALAKQWMDQCETGDQIVDKAIDYFRSNKFQYTLNPPLLDKDPIDAFLFETRKGYCEHYASAFAFLMRAAGIPARVVVGYLGGERNPYGNYLIVRQYHAHAWTEVFLGGGGWVRLDPTTAVAPERISMGLAESLVADELPDFLSQRRLGRVGLYWEKVKFMWDSINLRWNAWFMEFSRIEQMGLWMRLWLTVQFHTTQIILVGSGLIGILATMVLYRMRRGHSELGKDPVAAGYRSFCRKLERAGIRREAFQGPRDFAQQVSVMRSDLKNQVDGIIQRYIDLRYAKNGDQNGARLFVKQVKKFRPARARHGVKGS